MPAALRHSAPRRPTDRERVSAWARAARRSQIPCRLRGLRRLLSETQDAWSNEDVARLHTLATPEMVSYFVRDLDQNKAENVVNKVTGTRLLQGDLAEAWREGDTDYASVAMRYSLVDSHA